MVALSLALAEPSMHNDCTPWQETHTLRSYEVTPAGNATIATLGNLLQEAAGNHARSLGYGVEQLHARGLTWVLNRIDITIARLPRHGETITVTTWPSAGERLYVVRDFRISRSDGEVLAQAASRWLLLDLGRRRPVSPERNNIRVPVCATQPPAPHRFSEPIAPADMPEQSWRYSVTPADLDLNNHVNNVRYMEWALAPVPGSKQTGCTLCALRIQYQAETGAGDEIVACCQPDPAAPDAFRHHLRRDSDRRILAVAHSRWQPPQHTQTDATGEK